MEVIVDPIASVQGEAVKRIIAAGIFESSAIQRENTTAPDVLPYCRVTVPQGGDYAFSSQERMLKTVIIEFDILTPAQTGAQLARQLASKIEHEFGFFNRNPEKRVLTLDGWTGVSAVISMYGRSSATLEKEKGLYYLPVMLYVDIEVEAGAKYEI